VTCIRGYAHLVRPGLITLFHLEASKPCRDLSTVLMVVVQGYSTHDNIANGGPRLIMVPLCGVDIKSEAP
jgi:hypothetical protein